jgi:histidinol dehydrogenase
MPARLDIRAPGFAGAFDALLYGKRAEEEDVSRVAREIIADVRARGDAALIELAAKFDGVSLTPAGLRVAPEEIEAAWRAVQPELRSALELAARRIEAYHRRQLPEDASFTDDAGVVLGWRWRPLESVGLYVPGGTATYPSSVLMNAVPAQVAGVDRLVIVTPASRGAINPLILVAARIAGVSEIYRVGGAQAVAALAYGTTSIRPVAWVPATPMSQPPSGKCSVAWASIPLPARPRS